MEPEAQTLAINITGDHHVRAGEIAAVSVAISLKRIADVLEGTPGPTAAINRDVERLGLADAIGNSIYSALANAMERWGR
jgi:hypothetical protein